MSSRLDRLARVRGAVDRRHAETISVTPMAKPGQYKGVSADPDRPGFDIIGALSVAGGGQSPVMGGAGGNLQVADGPAQLFVDVDAWPVALTIRPGDRLTGADHAGSTFKVDRIDEHQLSRRVFDLIIL